MTETISHNGVILAILIPASFRQEGTSFFTPSSFPLQLGLMKRSAGHIVPPHAHLTQVRQITTYQEALLVRKGKIKVSLYSDNSEFVTARILSEGDCILLAAGGHGVEVMDDAEVLEIKQGPFAGDTDKISINKKPSF